MKHFGDITKIHGEDLPLVDIVTGGSPCQDLSVAGKRAGFEGERSGLFMDQIRIIKELRNESKRQIANGSSDGIIRPRYMVWENVVGAFTSGNPKGSDFRAVLEETIKVVRADCPELPIPTNGWSYAGNIDGLGDDGTPFCISWRVHDAQFWGRTVRDSRTGNVIQMGTPQRRRRISLVADFGGTTAPKILFECNGVSGNTEQSRETRERTTADTQRGTNPTSYTVKIRGGAEFDSNGNRAGKGALIQEELSGTLGVSQDQTLIAFEPGSSSRVGGHIYTDGKSGTIRANAGDNQQVIVQGVDLYNQQVTGSVTCSLNTNTNATGAGPTALVFDGQRRHNYEPFGEVCETIQAAYGMGGNNTPIVLENQNEPQVFGISPYDSNGMKSDNPNSGIYKADTARTLDLNGANPACNQGGMMVVQEVTKDKAECLNSWDIQSKHIQPEGGKAEALYSGECRYGGGESYVLQTPTPTISVDEGAGKSSQTEVVCGGFKPRNGADARSVGYEEEKSPTISTDQNYAVLDPVCVGNGQLQQARLSDKVGALNCMHDQQAILQFNESISIGNGQVHDAMSPSVEVSKTLNCMEDPAKVVCYGIDRPAFNQGKNAQFDFSVENDLAQPVVARGPGAVCNSVVRRLTPLECERLQGFPDNWTNIGAWVDSQGKKHKDADSPRYKALGNSICTPFWEWLANRMCNELRSEGQTNLTMGSLFDGIGGFPLVYSRCGCKPVWASEIEEFPIAVTKYHFGEE